MKTHDVFTYMVNYLIVLKQYRRHMIQEDHSGYLVIKIDKELETVRAVVRQLYDLIRNNHTYVPYNWYNKFEPPKRKVILLPENNKH